MATHTPQKKKDSWEHPQFEVTILEKYGDGAYKNVLLSCHDLPGIVAVTEQGKPDIAFQHRFRFTLPREYPQNLGKVKIISESPLYHPRITAVGTKACYTVNGEVDRILIDIIYNILLRPETVRPPSLYRDADWGLDSRKMQWYIRSGPQKIYDMLKEQWAQKQNTQAANKTSGKKVYFLD